MTVTDLPDRARPWTEQAARLEDVTSAAVEAAHRGVSGPATAVALRVLAAERDECCAATREGRACRRRRADA